MKLSILAGSTSQSINIFIRDSSSTTGGGLTGLVFNSASLVAYYALPNAAAVSITLATLAAITTAYSSGGFKEVDATNMPGWYRLDLPDAAIASGRFVSIHLKGATNMAPLPIEIELTAWNNQDGVRGGMTALPNAAAAAANGLPVLGTNATAISFTAGMTISSASGDALALTSSGGNGMGLNASGNGSGAGIKSTGGATGRGLHALGGATSGSGFRAEGQGAAAMGIHSLGGSAAPGMQMDGGATGAGLKIQGGATSGDGIDITTTVGDGLSILPTAGNAIVATANGTSKHGAVITGGTAGTSDGLKAVAGTGGVPIRGDQTGNITGNVTGSVGSVTGAVGSVTGLTASNLDAAVSSRSTYAGGDTSGTTMLLSRIASVITITGGKVDVNDKTGFALSSAGVQAVWDALTSALTTNGSIGKLLVTDIDATISSRLPTASYTTPDNADILLIKSKTDNLPASPASTGDIPTAGTVASAVWDALRSAHVTTGSFGAGVLLASGQIAVKKNVALSNVEFVMFDSSGDPTAGLTVTATRSIDGGAFAACANSVTEVSNGVYKINFAATDLNGNVVMFMFTASGADTTFLEVFPQP